MNKNTARRTDRKNVGKVSNIGQQQFFGDSNKYPLIKIKTRRRKHVNTAFRKNNVGLLAKAFFVRF